MVWFWKKKDERACDWCGQALEGDIVVTGEGLFFCSTNCRNQQSGPAEPSLAEMAMRDAEALADAFFAMLWQLYGTEVLEPYQAALQSLVTFSPSDRKSKLRDFAIQTYRKGVSDELLTVLQAELDAMQHHGNVDEAFTPRTQKVWIGWERIIDALNGMAGAMENAPVDSYRRELTFNERADAMEEGRALRRQWSKISHRYRRWAIT